MKRTLVGSSLCMLLLSGYIAPSISAEPVANPTTTQATPASSPPHSITSILPERITLSGLTPTQFVPYAATKIRAAQTDVELQQFERYFLDYHSRLSHLLANSTPTNSIERHRYQVATQLMALMRELAAACKLQQESKGVAVPDYHFQDAQSIANAIEHPVF